MDMLLEVHLGGRPLRYLSRSERIELGTYDFRDLVGDFDEFVVDPEGPSL